jgi:predicted RNA methylase
LYGEFNRDAHELLSQVSDALFFFFFSIHLCQVLRAGDAVVDAGAGFGVSALGSSGTVHAFEAQRVLSQLVCSNAATNQVIVSMKVIALT